MKKKKFRVYLYTRTQKVGDYSFTKLRAQIAINQRNLYISFPVMVQSYNSLYKTNGEFKPNFRNFKPTSTLAKFTDKAVKSAYLACNRVMEYVCTLPPQYAQSVQSKQLEDLTLEAFISYLDDKPIDVAVLDNLFDWHNNIKQWEGER